MIRYTLACNSGHRFESWFPSGQAYDEQEARGLVSCPICDSKKVGKTLMAPALTRASDPQRAILSPTAAEIVPVNDQAEQRVRAVFRAMHNHIRQTANDVGPRFAMEARSMHYGEIPHRAIYGAASLDEARALVDEGIDVYPLPPMPDDQN